MLMIRGSIVSIRYKTWRLSGVERAIQEAPQELRGEGMAILGTIPLIDNESEDL